MTDLHDPTDCAREWRHYQDERPLPMHDPRPDIASDSKSWASLLHQAWYEDRDLWGALHGLRCCGGRLIRDKGRTVLAPGLVTAGPDPRYPQGLSREEYAAFRETYLMPKAAVLRMLLGLNSGGRS